MPNQCCYVCGNIFANISSLRRHARNFHRDAAYEIAPNLYKNATKYNFNCQCGKNFNDKTNFNSHLKSHFEDFPSGSDNTSSNTIIESNNQTKNKKCPLCTESFTSKNEILKHFKEIHEIPIKSSIIEFNSNDEFHTWKFKLEANTNTVLSKRIRNVHKSATPIILFAIAQDIMCHN